MAQYRTLAAICKRMGWKKSETAIRKLVNEGFMMYRDKTGRPPRVRWTTSDELITLWEVARCKVSREHVVKSGKYERVLKSKRIQRVANGDVPASTEMKDLGAAAGQESRARRVLPTLDQRNRKQVSCLWRVRAPPCPREGLRPPDICGGTL